MKINLVNDVVRGVASSCQWNAELRAGVDAAPLALSNLVVKFFF